MGEVRDVVLIEKIAKDLVDSAIKVHRALGPGLLESVYVKVLVAELRRRGYRVRTEVPVNIEWEGEDLGLAFRADIVIEELVLAECKSVEKPSRLHAKQAETHARLLKVPLAFVLNFGMALMKEGVERVANDYFGGPQRRAETSQ